MYDIMLNDIYDIVNDIMYGIILKTMTSYTLPFLRYMILSKIYDIIHDIILSVMISYMISETPVIKTVY